MEAMETYRNTFFFAAMCRIVCLGLNNCCNGSDGNLSKHFLFSSLILFTQLQFLSTSSEIRNFTLFVSLMANLRCISFSMDYCWRLRDSEKDKPVKPYTLMDLLVYNFYLPLFANGPVVTFDTFQKTVSGF